MNRALLVGINAYPDAPLRGCVNDVTDMADFLVARCGFAEADIRLLTDRRATTAAMIERLMWLVSGAKAGDRLCFHYSGHGTQLPTRKPSGEVDGLDEVVCPVDFDWTDKRTLRDKDFVRIFKPVPKGVEFVWVSDSCHSGDLLRGPVVAPDAQRSVPRSFPMPADIAWRLRTARTRGLALGTMLRASASLNVALITGCRSDQTSADAYFKGRYNGAMTYLLLKTLKTRTGRDLPLVTLVPRVRSALRMAGFDQDPQLEGSAALCARPFISASGIKNTKILGLTPCPLLSSPKSMHGRLDA